VHALLLMARFKRAEMPVGQGGNRNAERSFLDSVLDSPLTARRHLKVSLNIEAGIRTRRGQTCDDVNRQKRLSRGKPFAPP
jgi:hypothetical protein